MWDEKGEVLGDLEDVSEGRAPTVLEIMFWQGYAYLKHRSLPILLSNRSQTASLIPFRSTHLGT